MFGDSLWNHFLGALVGVWSPTLTFLRNASPLGSPWYSTSRIWMQVEDICYAHVYASGYVSVSCVRVCASACGYVQMHMCTSVCMKILVQTHSAILVSCLWQLHAGLRRPEDMRGYTSQLASFAFPAKWQVFQQYTQNFWRNFA